MEREWINGCLLYTSDAADEQRGVDLGGRRIIKKKLVLLRFGEIKCKREQKPRIKKNINGNVNVKMEREWINGE